MSSKGHTGFIRRKRRFSVKALILIVLIHLGLFYGLVRGLAPDLTASVESSVLAAFSLPLPSPEPVPPPELPDNVAQGAAGDPGREAVPAPVSAPAPEIVLREDVRVPRAASTGAADRSGAADDGEGTGAAGSGDGTGSGNQGSGRGAGLVTRPVHISGEINNARDYPVPAGGRAARRGTEVIVKVIVGVDGRARDCTIYRPSPDPEADRLTCELVQKRLRFRPASDAAGNPVAAPFYWRQSWF